MRSDAVRRLFPLSVLALLVATLAACGALPSGAQQPAETSFRTGGESAGTPWRVESALAYAPPEPADGAGHLLDLYLPRELHRPSDTAAGPLPVVVWSSGSGWRRDDGRSGADQVATALVPRGYAVAGVSVRSSAQARFPAQVHDVKAAVRWLRAHAAEHGLDPDRIAVMGNSSGGWLAAMAGVTGDVPALEGTVGEVGGSSAVQAVVDLYGPVDFRLLDAHLPDGVCVPGSGAPAGGPAAGAELAAGVEPGCHDDPGSPESALLGCTLPTCRDAARAASPLTYVSPADPPMMLVHGLRDRIIPEHQSRLLMDALGRACLDATLYSVPRVGHEHPYLGDGGALSAPRAAYVMRTPECGPPPPAVTGSAPTWDVVAAFLDQALNG